MITFEEYCKEHHPEITAPEVLISDPVQDYLLFICQELQK